MSVHYKFKSALEFSTLPVDGVNISVEDLKEAIIQQKKLSKAQPFDLIVTNAETNKEYDDEKTLIPKNSSLLIARVPIDPSQLKKSWNNNNSKEATAVLLSNPANLMNTEDGGEAVRLRQMASQVTDLTKMTGTEDDVIHAMMAQSTLDYHPSQYVKLRNSKFSGKVPASYTCYKCSKGGHWVTNCPLSNQDLRKSYGIPSDQLKQVTDPNTPGVMVTTRGTLVVYRNAPVADLPAPAGDEEPRLPLPEELACSLCEELMKDAVLVPCCVMAYCDDCIRNHLIESDDNQCPKCLESDVSIGNLIPTLYLRKKCKQFDNKTNGNYIRSYEKHYSSPPTSVAPLPPHLRTITSDRVTPSASPIIKDAVEVSSTSNIISTSRPPSPDNGEATANKSDSSDKENSVDKTTLMSSNVLTSAADTTGPSSSPIQSLKKLDSNVEEREPIQLYRGLLKDVEEAERESRSKMSSPVQIETEKTKKVKKKKEKKKKESSKDKKKDKHRHGSKSNKSPRTENDLLALCSESPQSALRSGSGREQSKSPAGRGSKRDRSSDSASSGSQSRERMKFDHNSDLFNAALNIVPHPTPDNVGPYSDPFYPPAQPIFSVPPPGYPPSSMFVPPPVPETIDDPLEAFNKHLREQDERRRREQMRRQRSPSFSRPQPPRNRSWSRSRSRSPSRRHRSRSPRSRRYKWSRSRSPISPRHHSQSGRHQITPPSHRQYSPPSHRQYPSPPLTYRQYSPSGRRLITPPHHPSPSQQQQHHPHHYDRIRSRTKSRSVYKTCRIRDKCRTSNTTTGGVMVLSR